MGVKAAARVERRTTPRATIHAQVVADGQLMTADPAQDGPGVAFFDRPLHRRVIDTLLVTKMAGVQLLTTTEPDRHHVKRCAVVDAPCLVINRAPQDGMGEAPRIIEHCSSIEQCSTVVKVARPGPPVEQLPDTARRRLARFNLLHKEAPVALTRTAVVDAAWTLLRTYGLGDLTMRRLARELGVQPGALYWHVPNKQTLLLALAERMLEPVRDKNSPAELVRTLRRAILEVRDSADVIAVAHAVASEALPPTRELMSLLRASGLQDDEARRGALTLIRYTLGSISAEQTRTSIAGRSIEQDTIDEQDFETGLATILQGLATSQTPARSCNQL